MNVVIVGSGWAGCAAAYDAKRLGVDVPLLERTAMLLGTGLCGGIMRNNGRFTASEEMLALGGGDLFQIIEQHLRHKNINFPGHEHADLYDSAEIPVAIYDALIQLGVTVHLESRITRVEMKNQVLISVTYQNNNTFIGDVFTDTTGTDGPMNICIKYGHVCALCILRCPSFGGRVSLSG